MWVKCLGEKEKVKQRILPSVFLQNFSLGWLFGKLLNTAETQTIPMPVCHYKLSHSHKHDDFLPKLCMSKSSEQRSTTRMTDITDLHIHVYSITYACMNSLITFTIWGRWRKISAGKSWKTTSLRNSQALASIVTSLLCRDLPKKVLHFTTLLPWYITYIHVHGHVPVLQNSTTDGTTPQNI